MFKTDLLPYDSSLGPGRELRQSNEMKCCGNIVFPWLNFG